MKTYNIKASFSIDRNICPPFIVEQLFPNVEIISVQMDSENLLVTVPEGTPEPLNLSPLIKIELLS
jgi:hypothetical protein